MWVLKCFDGVRLCVPVCVCVCVWLCACSYIYMCVYVCGYLRLVHGCGGGG